MLPTMGVGKGQASLLDIAKQYIKLKYAKPGNVYLGTVSRLDAPVTGVVLFARTSKAAARLTEQFRKRRVEKTYLALVRPKPSRPEGCYVDWLARDERHRRMHVVGQHQIDAQEARLAYQTLASFNFGHLVRIRLETGRKHQIRVQFSSHGHPILGDGKYGGNHRDFPVGIALHARQLALDHPVCNDLMEFTAPVPQAWIKFGVPKEPDL